MSASKRIIYIQEVAEVCGLNATLCEEIINSGLVPFSNEDETEFFGPDAIELLKRMGRISRHLGINTEGMEVIMHMRERIIQLQDELYTTRMQLRYYESRPGTEPEDIYEQDQ